MKIFKLILFFLLTILISAVIGTLTSTNKINRPIAETCTLLTVAGIYIFFNYLDKIHIKELPIYPSIIRFKKLCYGIMIGLAMICTVYFLNIATGSISVLPNHMSLGDRIASIFRVLVIALAASVWEETAFRGYLLNRFSKMVGGHAGCISMAVVFGLMHLFSPLKSPQIVIGTFFAGLLLGYAFLYSGDLYLPIGIHFGWGFFNSVIFRPPLNEITFNNHFLGGVTSIEQGILGIATTAAVSIIFLILFKNLSLKSGGTHF